jgi:uncharacterized protein (TIGR02145 family)
MKSQAVKVILLLGLIAAGCVKDYSDPAETVTDIDGNLYATITIAGQTWMAENLRVTHYRDGKPIPSISDNREWSGAYTGQCCDYNFLTDEKYGKLYNWHAVEVYERQNIAPEGWHIPTKAEWQALIAAMGSEYSAGYRLKDSISWPKPHYYQNLKKCGFNAVPSGYRNYGGGFERKGEQAWFWTSTTDDYVYYKEAVIIGDYGENVQFMGMPTTYGFSVRCVKDR